MEASQGTHSQSASSREEAEASLEGSTDGTVPLVTGASSSGRHSATRQNRGARDDSGSGTVAAEWSEYKMRSIPIFRRY